MTANNIVFRLMDENDFESVLSNERHAYSHPWSEGNFRTSFNGRDEIWLICLEGKIAGHAVLSVIADEAHILNLCVAKAYQGQGFGREMLTFLADRAAEKDCRAVFLEVRISNQAAINLYQSFGFCEVGLRKDYYPASGGSEHAVVMALELKLDLFG
ncbi:MAG: ribosomal protein S18-alanine N-acetyltransferase [Hahellaceae bacterium]|nr:ribosomal protein S18-alanine N-acetyltransferase [Hahellaceae bacterium]MCP5169829.1 ribosomal protein S18-alanine N-acetyltransferase [Hahellaceae bacterium]